MMIAPLILALIAMPAAGSGDGPVILDFTASWCQPCQQMKPAVAQLMKAGYPVQAVDYDHSPLREKYNVKSIPTFIVVDASGRELARTQGYQPAKNIAELYNNVPDSPEQPAAQAEAVAEAEAEVPQVEDDLPPPKNPDPWKTVVRIKIANNLSNPPSIEFGSGTIIHSTPEETVILTCAHIFKIEGARRQFAPRQFPLKIEVHLSDGIKRNLSEPDKNGGVRAGVHMVGRYEGQAIDYDFGGDVGLIRIRPGQRLPYSPVVSKQWVPKTGLPMTTVGCSAGQDATAWSTQITKPLLQGVSGYPNYEAIECVHAPIQGRSGGGLYTIDGMLAGVCDFAEPQGGRGLYATPRTIHKLLDRNNLAFCYAPEADRKRNPPGQMLAQERPAPRNPRANEADTLRAQNPEEPARKKLTIPDPRDLGVADLASDNRSNPGNRRKPTWAGLEEAEATSNAQVRVASNANRRNLDVPGEEETQPTPVDVTLDSRIDRDPFSKFENAATAPTPEVAPNSSGTKPPAGKIWKPGKTSAPATAPR